MFRKSTVLIFTAGFLYAQNNIYVYEYHAKKREGINLDYERSVGVEYLNFLRQSANMTPFILNTLLNSSSQNHAKYLNANNQVGHYEDKSYQYFTGVEPKDRVNYVGYDAYEGENVTYGVESVKASIDNLFSAIYHRFGFLNYDANEIGIGIDGLNYVYNMGNKEINDICKGSSYSGYGYYYYGICIDYNFKIEKNSYDTAKNSSRAKNPEVILWPYNGMSDFEPPFFEESPDPLPNHSVSGNPISVKFNEYFVKSVQLISFELYKNGVKVDNTLILTKDNDPNSKFSEFEFALFPLDRLDWNTNYSVKTSFNVDGATKNYEWSFKTKSLDIPVYEINSTTAKIDIKPNVEYAIYLKPLNANDISNGYSSQYQSGMEFLKTDFIDMNTLKIAISGSIGQKAIFNFQSGRVLELTLSNTDLATYPTTNQNFTLNLQKGWNLVSIPVNKSYNSSIFSGDTTYTYNGSYTKNPTTLNPKQGIWVLSSSSKSYTFEGQEYSSDSFSTLSSGWSLLGAGKNITIQNEISCQNCSIKSSWTYNATLSSWSKNPSTINRGEGFWIYK
ncbi:MAG: CAP domain-containing protein [Campylobacterales bacterium]|nr:CAP domain-containing protein [Campylobacterales bacterium]